MQVASAWETGAPRKREAREAVEVGAPVLLAQYAANEVASDGLYAGRLVEVTGMVSRVGRDNTGTAYVALRGGRPSETSCVQCFFDRRQERELAPLGPGQEVVIRGRCDGKSGNVLVRDCEFVPEPSGPLPAKTGGPKLRAPQGQAAMAEGQAAQKLEFALNLARGGKGDKARQRCEEIIKTYPDTRAAADARNLLRDLE
jgi:tRNA_anti-like